MGFEDTITSGPLCVIDGNDLYVSWSSSSASGTTFQVYLDRVLRWSGTETSAYFSLPSDDVYVDVVAVDPGSGTTDYSASFPAIPPRRATLEWSGGRYLIETISGFNVYSCLAPGGSVSYATAVAFVPWAPLGLPQDGFGIGGFGCGGFGRSEVRYRWTSGVLANGSWTFGIVALDGGGALGPPYELTETITAPPRPPAMAGRSRLALAYNPTTRVPTLTWLASS
jgi:hypothetical protein